MVCRCGAALPHRTGRGRQRTVCDDCKAQRSETETRTRAEIEAEGHPATCDKDYTAEQVEFARAMVERQKRIGVKRLDCREILRVAHYLGYRKVG